MNIWKTIKIVFIIAVIATPVEAWFHHHYSPQARYDEAITDAYKAIEKLDNQCTKNGERDDGVSKWDTNPDTSPDCADLEEEVKLAEAILLAPEYKKCAKKYYKEHGISYEKQVFDDEYNDKDGLK
ncbi:hypothetical protein V7094_28600 [Priestia megaterium]|uniref:hypothetical protein n=1 Tax=Priestia megaterium TaxID=1404 RepID=UPI002FFEA3A8